VIVVYGATGQIGEQVARQLAERVEVACAGRDRRRLERVAKRIGAAEIHVAPAHDSAALEAAARDAQVVVNCADPFRVVGPPVLAAAIAGGAHYVDVAGDQGWLRRSYESSESPARRAGVVCVAGLGVEVAIGDWAAALARDRLDEETGGIGGDQPLDEIHIGYAMRSPRRSVLEDLAGDCAVWHTDRWERVAPGSRRRRFAFGDLGAREAVLFPRGEAITVPRHLPARHVATDLWLASGNPLLWEATRAAPLVAPLLAPLMSAPLRAIARSQARRRDRTDGGGEFAVVAEVSRGFSVGRVLIRGADPSALSARLAANAALSLASRPAGPGGMLAPSEAFDARTQLHLLESLGLIEVI
jgi:hypothetical protein